MAEEKTMDKVKIFWTAFWIILAVIVIAILIIVLLHLLGPNDVTDSPEAAIPGETITPPPPVYTSLRDAGTVKLQRQ